MFTIHVSVTRSFQNERYTTVDEYAMWWTQTATFFYENMTHIIKSVLVKIVKHEPYYNKIVLVE